MIKNYFKIAWRNIWKRKGFSAINIGGLAVGMASALLVLLWVQNEISYDRFHENGDSIYRMYNRDNFNGEPWAWGTTPKILGKTLNQDYPEVENVARISSEEFWLGVGNKKFKAEGYITDTGFLKMFSFPLLKGNISTVLNEPSGIVITENLALKLFGAEEAIGKNITVDQSDVFKVTGVLTDLPNNTQFDFDYLLPWSYMKTRGWDDSYWGNNSVETYVQLNNVASQASFDKRVQNINIDHTKDSGNPSSTEVFSWPLYKLHLYSKSENGQLVDGRIVTVRLFTVVGILILLIACINFMNLSTAQSEKRAREVGIRKVAGAPKRNLIFQFLGESTMIAFVAGVLGLILVQLSLHPFNTLVNKELYIDYSSIQFWLTFLGFMLFTGILAGSYPAFFLSSFKPIKVLKGTMNSSTSILTPRKVLVVLQFSFAIILIICTIIINRQINYAQQRDMGYNKNNLIYTFLEGDIRENYELIKQELLSSGAATAVTKTLSPVTQRYSDSWGFTWKGSTEEDKMLDFIIMSADADFANVMGVELVEGRDINIHDFPSDSTAVLLNETAVDRMRLEDPIGTVITQGDQNKTVVGVIKDFIIESPYDPIEPMMINGPSSWFGVLHIKLNPGNTIAEDLALAKGIFKKYNPEFPFEYHFVDEAYAKKFESVQQTASLAALFAALTVFISCLGLFGLATYIARNRIKEIGIRKVMGAGTLGIVTLLSRNFLKLVLVAFCIASPIAWYAMEKWLQSYSYSIGVEWWVFLAVGFLVILIAMLTVSFQAIKAAIANPVKSLRTE
ncbi:ABC transporter permease [Salinimicrobium marinum]|uniref:ABC transporter permease n=1 Tax=Salinimicrobium marinum TaxID=680283 RepID=A0A918SDX3_9FLAO|nr:ABC transporter permease [Salinimicrobium marinum]GHA33887.1 ABC transporter permease [Salinimicrobium marinum]